MDKRFSLNDTFAIDDSPTLKANRELPNVKFCFPLSKRCHIVLGEQTSYKFTGKTPWGNQDPQELGVPDPLANSMALTPLGP